MSGHSEEESNEWDRSRLNYEVRVAGDVHIVVQEGAQLIINSGEPTDPPPPDPPDGGDPGG